MSLPVSFPRNLPERWVPVENDDFYPFDAFLDDAETQLFEVAFFQPGVTPRPVTVFTANPGPKTPTTIGRYAVLARATGSPKPAICVGYLNVF